MAKKKQPAKKSVTPFPGIPAARKKKKTKTVRKNTSPASLIPAKNARNDGFPVVGIGASAGGLEALEELLKNMPPDTGMAFVVVTHQHPGHTSLLPELLGKETVMPVIEAHDGTKLKPNHVYIGPPGGILAILNGTLCRMETEKQEAPRLPIDFFFRSLAEDQKEKAICIVLSGTGTDGTLGLKAIKGESGMAMVQQPASAKYAGMPASAIASGLADYVLAPAAMPEKLIAYSRGPYLVTPVTTVEQPSIPAEPMQKIFLLLRGRTGHDFTAYKSNTIRRRIERRMNVHQIKKPRQYVRYLQENPHEIDILFKELLITVTNFFRDPDAWDAFIPLLDDLVREYPASYSLRAWVPGCATGEEPFSLAIALRESMEKVNRYMDIQIFGTDLDAQAIETARAGLYPDGIAVDIPPNLLERYFIREDSSYRIRKEIREMTVFAQQNVIKDPPFTKLDIICCRNLLIYLNTDLQKKLLPIFHYSLKPNGLIFLGPSETIGQFNDLFEPLDKRWKIYRRKESATAMHILPDFPAQPYNRNGIAEVTIADALPVTEVHVTNQIERLLLTRFAPASVVVNERGDIIYIHGRTGMYLEPAPGQPRNNILEMARDGLQIELATALRECNRKGMDIIRDDISVRSNGDYINVSLMVTKIQEPETVRGLFLLTFRPTPPPSAPVKNKKTRPKAGDANRVTQLELELQYIKESHQTTQEELETSNEELKSTNEELQSTNEELQSTNEELETSKEELQSLNEELTTVNAELQAKVDELSQANDDMLNLLNSTDIATVFLDNDLNIKRFTDRARELVSLRQTDIGRPLSELASSLLADNLTQDCRNVLKTLVFKEAEVETRKGSIYLMRIMPYRTVENVIDGLVLTFVNIERLKQAERAGESARILFKAIVDTVREPLVVLNQELRVVSANGAFYKIFHTAADQIEGEFIYKLDDGRWNIPKLRTLLEEILPRNTVFEDYEVELEVPETGSRRLILNARRLQHPEGRTNMILLAMEDMTNK